MNIVIKVQSSDHPSPYPIADVVLDSSLAALVPQVDDQITNGMTVRRVTGRVFQYNDDGIVVTLISELS